MQLFRKLSRKWKRRKTTVARKEKRTADQKSRWVRLARAKRVKKELQQAKVMLVVKSLTRKSLEVWAWGMSTHAHLVHSMNKTLNS